MHAVAPCDALGETGFAKFEAFEFPKCSEGVRSAAWLSVTDSVFTAEAFSIDTRDPFKQLAIHN